MSGHYLRLAVVVSALTIAPGCTRPAEEAEPHTDQATAETSRQAAPHETPHWSYTGESGPSHWGSLSGDWSLCGTGRSQSPIDIDQTMYTELTALRAEFKPTHLRVIHQAHVADGINNGHTIQINYTNGDVLSVGDQQFELKQYHFHSPSEHTVGGHQYPMEMHLVHKSADGALAVIGVFIEEGQHNAALDPIWANLPQTKGAETHLQDVLVDVDALLPATRNSFRYEGSLTTPPCSEGVKWIVLATPIQFSAEQIGVFRAIIPANNRPVQALNGRPVVTDVVTE